MKNSLLFSSYRHQNAVEGLLRGEVVQTCWTGILRLQYKNEYHLKSSPSVAVLFDATLIAGIQLVRPRRLPSFFTPWTAIFTSPAKWRLETCDRLPIFRSFGCAALLTSSPFNGNMCVRCNIERWDCRPGISWRRTRSISAWVESLLTNSGTHQISVMELRRQPEGGGDFELLWAWFVSWISLQPSMHRS